MQYMDLPESPFNDPSTRQGDNLGRTTAVVTGSVALGALLTGAVLRRVRQHNLRLPSAVPPALDASVRTFELMEGRVRFYHRDGAGVPVVLLHSLNAAASSAEMQPLFDHLAAHTTRPLYAMDWLGFGLSERPPVRYSPSLYIRQLRRFLSEYVHQPADLVALSLGCEYGAAVGHSLPYLVRRLALIAPTALAAPDEASLLRQTAVRVADHLGAFEALYYRLTREEALRGFYERQVFRDPAAVPGALVSYARETTQVRGAHHAPRYFVEGALFTRDVARHAYAHLRVPTRFLLPQDASGLIQNFDRLDDLLARNPSYLSATRLPGGLLPHWESPGAFFPVLDDFLSTD